MAKPPLTRSTAPVGVPYKDAIGNTYINQLSPYANDGKTTIPVLQPAKRSVLSIVGPAGVPGRSAPSPLADTATPAAVEADQPTAVVEDQAAVPEIADPQLQATPVEQPEGLTPEAPAPDYTPEADPAVVAAHLSDLRQRQTEADANNQATDDFLTQLDHAPPAPADATDPVPTIAQQPIQAGMIPPGALQDIGRGAVEAPDMVMSGAKQAVRNLLVFSDHLGDLVEEHVPATVAWTGDQSHLDAAGHVQPGGDGSNHMVVDSARNLVARGFPDSRPLAQFDREFPDTENDKPHSVTGGLIKGVSQFATGWAGAGGILRGWKAAAGAGTLVKSFAQGALTDFGAFDAHQQRLSNMLQQHAPEAIKPIFDYLAADPRDGEVEGRLKNALEGLGLGAATHGLITWARALRSARVAQRAAQIAATNEGLQGVIDAPQAAVETEAAKFHEDLGSAVGSPTADGFTINRRFPLTAEEVAAGADAEEMGPNTIGLNYAKITDSADMQAAAVQFYDAMHPEITAAKRGVQSIDQQIDDAFGADVTKLLGEWRPGTAMASHELTALRFAQAGAMKDFLRQARTIAGGDSSLAAQAAFLQTGGVLDALTRAVEGGKAEAARSLRSLRETIPSMVGDMHTSADAIEFYRKVDALVAGAGGREMVQNAAKAFLAVAQGNPAGSSKFLRLMGHYDQFQRGSKEVIRLFMTNGLLTVPGTTANIIGNVSALVWERIARQLAPHLSGMVGAPSYVATQEAIASQGAVVSAFGDVFRLSEHLNAGWDIRAQGRTLAKNFDAAKDATKGFSRAHREEVNIATGKGAGPGLERGPENDTALGRVTRLVYAVVKTPGQTHGVLDDFSNIIAGRAELASQAYRQAMKDSETGLITADQVGAQMQKYMEDPDAAMIQRVVDAQQQTSWTRVDPQGTPSLANGMKAMRTWGDSIPIPFPLGTALIPFVNTPANLFSYGVRSSILAPISTRFWHDMRSADGAVRQLAMTKYAMGSLVSLWVMNHVANGDMTGGGPHDPNQKAAMMRTDPDTHTTIWQPYSIRIGDNWVDMSRLDPASTNFALSADLSEAWLASDWSDAHAQTAEEAFAATAMNIGSAFLNKSTMQGVSQIMDAMADSQKGGVAKAEAFFDKRAKAALPFSSLIMAARKTVDPYQREVRGIVDTLKDMTPGLSSTLPLSLDLWGRKRSYETGMGQIYDFAVPARAHPIGGEPADREMLRLGYAKQMPSTTIHTQAGPADLRNYPSIANEIVGRGGPAALNEINDLVSGASPNSDFYNSLADGSDQNAPGSKARYLKGRLNFHFGQATQSVKRDFADELSGIAAEQATRRAAARTGP